MDQPKNGLEILAPAQRELDEIALIHLELAGVKSSRKITNSIYNSLQLLQTSPNMGVDYKPLKLQGYRMLICGHYLCIYRVLGDTGYVYHIVDGKANYPKLAMDLKKK
jgi:plasmid stabilization system protein ParE